MSMSFVSAKCWSSFDLPGDVMLLIFTRRIVKVTHNAARYTHRCRFSHLALAMVWPMCGADSGCWWGSATAGSPLERDDSY